jgi:dTMP kinase
MDRGLFIVIEGPNRAGKTTLIKELASFIGKTSRNIVVTREPGGTPFGEGLRAVLKNPTISAGTFASALVFDGGRKEHADKVILPAVDRGAIVICDRYYMSTEIFQGVLATDITPAELDILKNIHKTFPLPDLTVFVIPTLEVITARGAGTEGDRFEGNPRELSAYAEYAADFALSHPSLILRPTLTEEGQSLLPALLRHPLLSGLKA